MTFYRGFRIFFAGEYDNKCPKCAHEWHEELYNNCPKCNANTGYMNARPVFFIHTKGDYRTILAKVHSVSEGIDLINKMEGPPDWMRDNQESAVSEIFTK